MVFSEYVLGCLVPIGVQVWARYCVWQCVLVLRPVGSRRLGSGVAPDNAAIDFFGGGEYLQRCPFI